MPSSFSQGKDFTAQMVTRLGCRRVLDIGPGRGSYAELFATHGVPVEKMDCVEVWEPYIERYSLTEKYSLCFNKDVREWDDFNYDLVIFGDVLEHMSKKEAVAVWEKVSKQATYAVISIPIVHMPQGEEEGNPYETHVKDDWTVEEVLETFSHIGLYRVYRELGIFFADFTYEGEPQLDDSLEDLFAENKDVYGGTELMVRRFRADILPDLPKFRDYRCLVIPGGIPSVESLFDGTPTVVWLHITPGQMSVEAASVLRNALFQKQVAYIVVVSEWHKQCITEDLGIDPRKVFVIPNATDPVPNDPERFQSVDKVQIVHASTPDRGMEILIPAVHRIPYDFELKVFNIYNPDLYPPERDIEHIVLDPRITYYGRTPHKTVMKYMAEGHIHAYPAVWQETACITQIEALVAGMCCVVSDRSVLPETSMGYGMIVPFTGDRDKDIANYGNYLANAIQLVKSGKWEPAEQSRQVYNYYSWERCAERWHELHERLP